MPIWAFQKRIIGNPTPEKAAFVSSFADCDELFVINQRFPKNIHTCTKDIAEQFDLKQAIKIPNLLSSQYAMWHVCSQHYF